MTLVLHQSAARTFRGCPLKWKSVYLDGLEPVFPPFRRGTAIHLACERVTVARVKDDNADMEAVALAALREYQETSGEPLSEADWFDACEVVTRMVQRSSRLWWGGPGPGHTCQVELDWAMDENFMPLQPGDERAAYAGRIDRLDWPTRPSPDGRMVLRDWKSSYLFTRDADVEALVQARVYSLWVIGAFPGMPRVECVFTNVRQCREPRATLERDGAWVGWTKAYLSDTRRLIAEAVEAGEFPARVGESCNETCPILHACVARKQAVFRGAHDDSSVPDRARLYLAAKPLCSDAAVNRLKGHAEEQPIDLGNGKVLGLRPGTRRILKGTAREAILSLQALGATDEQIDKVAPNDRIRIAELYPLLESLVHPHGHVEDPSEELKSFLAEVPTATFTTFAGGE